MRGMRSKLFAWTLILTTMAALSTSVMAQTYLLMNLTNQVWSYNQTDDLTGTGWEGPGYDASAWPSGRSVLAYDNSAGCSAFPYTNTVLCSPNNSDGRNCGRVTYYFRTTFTLPTAVTDPSTLVITSSNFLDDGAVFYINGHEVQRYDMPTGPVTYTTGATTANPAGDCTRFTITLTNAGTYMVAAPAVNLMAVEVHQSPGGATTTSSDVVWGTDLRALTSFCPRIDDASQPRDTNVVQCRAATLNVVASGAPAPTYQWVKDLQDIPGATSSSYAITNMTAADAGDYYCKVQNSVNGGCSVNSRHATVGYTADTSGPILVSALGDGTDATRIVANLDEGTIGADFAFYWLIDYQADPVGTGAAGSVVAASYIDSAGTQVALTLDTPRDPSKFYKISVQSGGDIKDTCANNPMADQTVNVTVPAVFRQGTAGYAGCQDTDLRFALPDAPQGSRSDFFQIDLSDGTPAGPTHGLLRFDNIVGNNPGQIPPFSTVTGVQLVLQSSAANAQGDIVEWHRMLVNWDQATATWNSMVDGVSADNAEASSVIDSTYGTAALAPPFTVTRTDEGLRQTVQMWVNGTNNYGWACLPTGGDGYRIDTSESPGETQHPMLIVSFNKPPPSKVGIATQPASVTVDEGQPANITVVATGSDPVFQWFKGTPPGGTAVTGGTAATLHFAAAKPSDAGSYWVKVTNSLPSSTNSQAATLTVRADTAGPVLASAVGNADQTTITLTFTDQQATLDSATAQSTANYTLTPIGGGANLTISSAVLSGKTVTLTTAPRVAGTGYSLTIRNVKDTAQAGNVINPNPTVVNPLEQHVTLLTFNTASWRYNNSGCDQGTAWRAEAYIDSAWPSATGPVGFENTSNTLYQLNLQGVSTNNLMLLSRTNANGCGVVGGTGATNITDYFRTTVNIPFSLAGAVIQIRHVIDDGAVIYFNGTEVGRFNMTNGPPVTYLTQAPGTMTEGVIRTMNIANVSPLHTGANSLAVEVHQDAPGSSDVVLGAEVTAVFGVTRPRLKIVNNGNGTATLSWTGSGTLQQANTLGGTWTDSGTQTTPQTVTISTGTRFYSIR